MRINEFGKSNDEAVVLIHPSAMTWEYFENLIPLLENDYHLFVPVLPGYDMTDNSDFVSVEETAAEIADGLLAKGIREVKAVYGCSMGGSIVLRISLDGRLKAHHYIMDGGITPYQLPWILTRFIALRDFSMLAIGKYGGEKVMVKAFSGTQYSEEDLKYIASVLRHCSCRTLWNTFDSCNNYKMPKKKMRFDGTVHYWYAEQEIKARKLDIKYMKKFVPDTVFKEFKGMDHADLAYYHAELLAEEIRAL